MADASLYIYHSETQAKSMTSPPMLVAMSIDTSSDQPYGSVPVGSGHGLGHSSDYRDIHFLEFHNPDHNMEGSPASPPSTFSWDTSSIPPPTPYQFPSYLEDDLGSWPDSHSPQFQPDLQFNEAGNGFHSASYSDGFIQDPMTSANTQLSDPSYFDDLPSTSGVLNFPRIIIDEGSSNDAEQQLRVVGNLPEFPSLTSPLNHDAGSAHLSRGPSTGVIPNPHSRSEHEQPPQEPLLPLTFQTRGYPMHSYESPLDTEDPDYKKNPEAMRNTWIADYSRFVDGHKVFKIFSKHAKEKVATINTIKASAARRTNPAKFKCPIRGCGADFTRKHNLENHLKSHCGVTDRICGLCGKGFTTIPVWKRHQKSCEKAASSSKAATPKGFLDAVTTQRPA